jgi:hypothetical protein
VTSIDQRDEEPNEDAPAPNQPLPPGGNNSAANASNASNTGAPTADPLKPNGQEWLRGLDVVVDSHVGHRRTQLHFSSGLPPSRDARQLEYFNLLFPQPAWARIVKATNKILESRGVTVTTLAELQRYLGIRLTMAVEGACCSIDEYWATEQASPYSISVAQNYGKRFSMGKTRFKALSSAFRLMDYDDDDLVEVNQPLEMRSFFR